MAGSMAVLALGASISATAAPLKPVRTVEGIDEYRLPNGLTVLLAPDESKPSTTVNVTYSVGSRHENYGETGMAHLLEHLIFKGTPKHPKVWPEFTKRGLRANGSTWLDRTNYFATFTYNEDNLRWYLAWQADAMVNSFIARKDLDTEMTVVRNEMERGENDASRILQERGFSAMYSWHNYGKSTIGARSDVENVDIGRLQAFYRLYYQPDNATLIVSGKFDPAKVIDWVAKDFGKIPKPKRVLPLLYTIDPVQDGERQVTLRRSGGAPMLMANYHVPPGPHPDTAAFEVLGMAMSDAPGGRLHKALVDTQLAASVFAANAALHDPGFAFFGAQLAPGGDVDKAREALLRTVETLGTQPITEEELNRARAKWLKDWDLQFSNPESVGVAMSEAVAQGDWRLFFLLRDRVRTVTLADVNRVAVSYLQQTNRTLAVFLPADKAERAPKPANVDLVAEFSQFKPVATIAKAEAFDASPANIEARTRRFDIAPGMKVALLPKGTRGEVVQAQLRLLMGDENSLKGQEQVADTLASMLDKGTTTMSRQQVQDRLVELKAQVGFSSDGGSLSASIVATKATLPDTITLIAQMLRQPALPAPALDEVRREGLAQIEEARKEPESLAQEAIDRYGNPYARGDLRYARTVDEVEQDLKALTVEQLKQFHQRFVGLANAQFAAVGAMDADAVRAALENGFAGWQAATPFTRIPKPLVNVAGTHIAIETPDKQNANLRGRLALPIRELDPDHAALQVANFVFGSGGNSRLWKRIRENEGLSYGVGSGVQWSPIDANSTWVVGAIFAPQNRGKVETAFREELDRSLKLGFTAQEVAEAKQGMLSSRRLARAQDGAVAGTLLQNAYLGRTSLVSQQLDDAIAAVTPESAIAAWRKYIDPSRLVIAVGGDFKGQ